MKVYCSLRWMWPLKFKGIIISERANTAIVAVIAVVGIIFIAALIYVYIRAEQESARIYEEMVEEVKTEKEALKYGYGAVPDEELSKEDEEEGKKQAPIIYVVPRIDRKMFDPEARELSPAPSAEE